MQYFERRLRSSAYSDFGKPHMSVKVPLVWLIQNIYESCDFGSMREFDAWTEMMEDKASDTGFGHLVESIMKRGFMRDGSIGYDFEDRYINEGHHRLVAAILLGLDYVYVSRNGGTHYNNAKLPNVCAHYHDGEPYPIELQYA